MAWRTTMATIRQQHIVVRRDSWKINEKKDRYRNRVRASRPWQLEFICRVIVMKAIRGETLICAEQCEQRSKRARNKNPWLGNIRGCYNYTIIRSLFYAMTMSVCSRCVHTRRVHYTLDTQMEFHHDWTDAASSDVLIVQQSIDHCAQWKFHKFISSFIWIDCSIWRSQLAHTVMYR